MSNFIEMKVRVANDSIVLPIYETNSSAGMDLRAYLLDGNILHSLMFCLVETPKT